MFMFKRLMGSWKTTNDIETTSKKKKLIYSWILHSHWFRNLNVPLCSCSSSCMDEDVWPWVPCLCSSDLWETETPRCDFKLHFKMKNKLMILRHNSNDGVTFSLLFLFVLRRDRSTAMRVTWMFLWCVEHCNTTLLSRSSHVRYNHKYMDVIYLHVAPRVFSPHALMRLCGHERHANDCQTCASLTKHGCFRQMTFTSFEDRIYLICGTFMLHHFLFLAMRYRSQCFLLWRLMSMYLRHYCDL